MTKPKMTEKTISDSICHVHKSSQFTILSNCYIRSTRIGSDTALLLTMVMSLPPRWNYTINGLAKIANVGKSRMKRMLNELKEWGYLTVTKLTPDKAKNGRFEYVYDFYEYSEKDDSIPKYDVVLEVYTAENATLYRTEKKNNYTVISNKVIWDNSVDPKPRGILLKVLTLPNKWHFTMSGLVAICKEGITAVKSAVSKLIEAGYLVRTQLFANETISSHIEYVYEFFEKALNKEDAEKKSKITRKSARKAAKAEKAEKPKKSRKKTSHKVKKQETENQSTEEQSVESLSLENQALSNKEPLKNKNQKPSDKSSIHQQATCEFSTMKVEKQDEMEGYEEEKAIYTDLVRQNVEYNKLAAWLDSPEGDGYEEADEIINTIVSQIISREPYEYICGKKFPRSVVRSVMMKVDLQCIEDVINQMSEVGKITKHEPYLVSCLYNQAVTKNFRRKQDDRCVDNALRRDMPWLFT